MTITRGKEGLTLVEVLLAVGISALICSVLGAAIFQIVDRSAYNSDRLRALHDIHNAGRWLYLDGARAEATDLAPGAEPADTMRLDWTSRDGLQTSAYSLSGTELQRSHNGAITTVARYVSGAEFSMSRDRLITVNLASTPGSKGVSKEVTYRMWLRPRE